VRSLADWGLSAINLTSDGVVRTPTDGVTEYGHTTATATDGSQVLVGDVAFDFSTLSDAAGGDASGDMPSVTGGDASALAPVVGVAGLVDALDQVELVDLGSEFVEGTCDLTLTGAACKTEPAGTSPAVVGGGIEQMVDGSVIEFVDLGAGVVYGECSLPVPGAYNEAAQASAGAAYQYAAPTNDTATVLIDQHLVSSAGVL
jgi:hypothetical protein